MQNVSVVFDWDGTLIDTDFLMDEAIEKVFKRRGISNLLNEVSSMLYKARPEGILLRSIKLPHEHRSEIISEIASEFKRLDKESNLFEGASELLFELKSLKIPLGIFTGRDRDGFDYQLAKKLPSNLFKASICRHEAPLKPNPEGLEILRNRLYTKSVIFIGNTLADFKCAESHGSYFIGVDLCSRKREQLIPNSTMVLKSNYSQVRNEILNIIQ